MRSANGGGFSVPTTRTPTSDASKLDYQEAITLNAHTGIPLQIASGPAGHVTVLVSYVVTRVKLADIAAGKF